MQRVFKENDIVWRKMPLNEDVSYYRVTEYNQKQDRLGAISLLNGTEGIIETKDLHHYWLQIGDNFIHADDGVVVRIINIRIQGERLVVDVSYLTGTRGTFSISEQFCRSIILL